MTTNIEAIPFLLEMLAECERIKAQQGSTEHHRLAAQALDRAAILVRDMYATLKDVAKYSDQQATLPCPDSLRRWCLATSMTVRPVLAQAEASHA